MKRAALFMLVFGFVLTNSPSAQKQNTLTRKEKRKGGIYYLMELPQRAGTNMAPAKLARAGRFQMAPFTSIHQLMMEVIS